MTKEQATKLLEVGKLIGRSNALHQVSIAVTLQADGTFEVIDPFGNVETVGINDLMKTVKAMLRAYYQTTAFIDGQLQVVLEGNE